MRFPLTLPNDVVAATGIVRTLSLSGDGSLVAFAARGATGVQQIYVRPVNDTVVRPVAGTDGAVASFFSPDGKWLAFMTGSHLRKVDLGTGTVLTLADLAGLYFGGMLR